MVGKHGTLVLKGRYPSYIDLDIIDTNRKTSFKTKLSDKYGLNCLLWKPENEALYIFCEVDKKIPKGEYNFLHALLLFLKRFFIFV